MKIFKDLQGFNDFATFINLPEKEFKARKKLLKKDKLHFIFIQQIKSLKMLNWFNHL